MKRYRVDQAPDGHPRVVVHPTGPFVLFDDAERRTFSTACKRIAELEAEVLSWQKCCREGQEMLNTIGRQLGGQIPEQLVSEVAHQRMAEIAELEAASRIKQLQVNDAETRIAELEKQAATDKTLLALADARINRELRDDFAGRAMPVVFREDCNYPAAASSAYQIADAMLKAKGGV